MTARHLSIVPDRPRPLISRLVVLLVRAAPHVLNLVLLTGWVAAGYAVGVGLYHGDSVLLVGVVCGAVGWSAVALWLLVFDPYPRDDR